MKIWLVSHPYIFHQILIDKCFFLLSNNIFYECVPLLNSEVWPFILIFYILSLSLKFDPKGKQKFESISNQVQVEFWIKFETDLRHNQKLSLLFWIKFQFIFLYGQSYTINLCISWIILITDKLFLFLLNFSLKFFCPRYSENIRSLLQKELLSCFANWYQEDS